MTAAWFQTASGRPIDLIAPSPAMIDFQSDVPDHLARIARFSGATPAGPYSVGQHTVHGADALKAETGRNDLAFAFLLHDAPEYVLGDMTSPVATLYCELARIYHSVELARAMHEVMKIAHGTLDAAIHAAAGVVWPLPEETRRAVKCMDLRMLLTERNHLLRRPPMRWNEEVERQSPVRFSFGAIKAWPWPKAADEWRDRFAAYRPKPSPRTQPLARANAKAVS